MEHPPFLHLFSEHPAHDFHALWVERMSGTLAEGRSDLGVRLAPAAVAVGEVGHSEDAGQQRQMYQPEQAHDDKGRVCEQDQMLFVMIRFLEKGPDAVKYENIASERAARAAGCCIFIILQYFYTIHYTTKSGR